MNTKKDPVQFRPVRTLESKLGTEVQILDGYLYFTVDTQKIFLGMPNGEKMSMGGNTGIFYGVKEIEYPDDGNAPNPEVVFVLSEDENESELEGNRLPLVDDLVLNIDGCFYRVVEVLDETSILTNRITLQGTGGGGGNTGGGGDATLRIAAPSGTTRFYSSGAMEIPIDIIAYSSDLDNYISVIECSFDKNFSENFLTLNLFHPMEKAKTIDLIDQKSKFSDISKKVYLRVTDKYGATRSTSYNITLAKLEIESLEEPMLQVRETSFTYQCKVGGSPGVGDRVVEYHFYDSTGVEITEYYQYYILEDNQFGAISKVLSSASITHGSYELRVVLTGIVNGVKIESETLVHKLIRYDALVSQPVFAYLLPNKVEQYTDIPVSYMLAYGNEQREYLMDILVDGELLTTQSVTTGEIERYTFAFDRAATYKVNLQIADLNIDETFNLVVTKYTGTLPVINADRDDLQLYLTAKGRTNDAADKEYWPDYKNSALRAKLNNFYYRSVNGWMVDESGTSYLKLTQGANVELLDFTPFDTDLINTGYTIELDFMIDGIFDYDANLIECLSYTGAGAIKTGFVVQGDTFKYYAGAKELVSLSLVKGKRIKLSFVIEQKNSNDYPMCYTFLNGIISNVFNYDKGVQGNFANNAQNPAHLKINSEGGHINIYSIRFYNTGLDEQTILNNYQATLGTLRERQASYEENLIRRLDGSINLDLIAAENYPLQIPYVKIIGGYKSGKDFIMAAAESNVQSLPTNKKDYRAIDIEVIYPTEQQNPYFKNYQNFKMTTTFEDTSLTVLNGFGHEAVTGAIMYAQGTSSLEYPVKNLRVKFRGGKIKVRPDLEAVNLITFKADFMESSGSHNTGAANFIDTAYDYAGMETPGQAYFEDESIVTCIKGHPCVIFWSKTGEPGTFEYIGKYNLNLDKATPEPFGFKNVPEEYDASASNKFGWNEDGTNSIFCFEFLDNNVKVCNFLSDETSNANADLKTEEDRYYDTWYGTRVNEDKESVPGWCIGFESRHPEDKVGLHDADALWPLASWLNSLYYLYKQELAEGLKPTDVNKIYEYTEALTFDENAIYYIVNEDDEWEIAYPLESNFADNTYYTRTLLRSEYAMESIRRFKDEYQEYLDPDFLLSYYVITEALLMADSRVKNMMIATWGKERRTFKLTDGTEKTIYNYIWYPIFYDMDTMLGLDNIGYVNKHYYDEDTTETVFNGDEVLWKFVRDALPEEIDQCYNKLETSNGILTKNGILPFFNNNQANLANETFYNEDAFYKYINTFRNGYQDDLNEQYIAPGTGTRLYAAQGDRSMMREWFIENRIKYLRGKHSSTGYQSGDRIEFRLTYPVKATATDNIALTEEQIKTNKSIDAVPPKGEFHYTSAKTGYAGVKIGKNSTPTNKRFVDEESQTITIDTSSGNGTETYLLGVSNLSSVGDLSDKYLYKLVVGTTENNLKELILGNHHPDYYNPFWSNETSIELNGFKYLEYFNLENCGSFTGTINFSDSPSINKILLTGSSTSSITLPVGGVLEELRCPNTLTNLSIDSHSTLSDSGFTVGYYDYDNETYVNDFSKLLQVSIKGTPNINSYNIVRDAIVTPDVINLEYYCFQDFTWVITEENDLTYDNKGNVSGIKALDILKEQLNTYDGIPRSEALIGTIIVNVANVTVNEFDIYQKYHGTYPNVIIRYGENTNTAKAVEINFYNVETITANTKPYYTVLSNGNYNLKYLTSLEGPAGAILSAPQKLSTVDTDYTFSGVWKVVESYDDNFDVNDTISTDTFETVVPTGDLKLVPIFTPSERKYEIILYDYDETELVKAYLPYNADIGASLEAISSKSYYNYREYTGSKENYRYEFKGWQSEYDYHNSPNTLTYNTLDGKEVKSKLKLYAYYAEENCLTTPSNSNFFTLNPDHSIIRLVDKYNAVIQGKVTIPSTVTIGENTYTPTIIGENSHFFGNSKITEVFFMPDAPYIKINDEAFVNCYQLTKIHNFPNITIVGNRAFANCSLLELDTLPDSIERLGVGCFAANKKISLSALPQNLKEIQAQALSGCDSLQITQFGTATSAPNLTYIYNNAFYDAGDNISEDIYIGQTAGTVLTIENGAFNGYGSTINTLYIGLTAMQNDYNTFGITANNIVVEGQA